MIYGMYAGSTPVAANNLSTVSTSNPGTLMAALLRLAARGPVVRATLRGRGLSRALRR